MSFEPETRNGKGTGSPCVNGQNKGRGVKNLSQQRGKETNLLDRKNRRGGEPLFQALTGTKRRGMRKNTKAQRKNNTADSNIPVI